MKRVIPVLAILGGCASVQPQAPCVPVKVEVPVPCRIEPPPRPAFAVDSLPVGADIWDKMSALRAERQQRKGYEAELEAAIRSCQ